MKICVIGNSHTISLQRAWARIEEMHPEVTITFFYNPGAYYDQFVVDEDRKILTMPNDWILGRFALSSGTDGTFDFKDYDICFVTGGINHQFVSLLGQLGGQLKAGFSEQAIMAALQDLFGMTMQSHLMPKIRQVSDIPVYLFHDPITAHKEGLSKAEMKHDFHPYDYKLGLKLLNDLVMSTFDAEYIEQPPESLAAQNWTKFELCIRERAPTDKEIEEGFKGSVMEDRGHMTPEFGAMLLAAFLKKIGAPGG